MARYYSSTIGRFISVDSAGFAQNNFDKYKFVKNNPSNLIDINGFDWVWPWDKRAVWGTWRGGEAVGTAISHVQVTGTIGLTGEVYLGPVHFQASLQLAGSIDLKNGSVSIGSQATTQGG